MDVSCPKRRRQLDSTIEMMNFENLKESLGISPRSFIRPSKRTDSNNSRNTLHRESTRSSSNKRKNVKDEPITPRSHKNPNTSERSSSRKNQEETTGGHYSCKTNDSSTTPKQSSVIWKGPNMNSEKPFKIRCNLRVSFSNDKSSTLPQNRKVYAMDCNEDCGRFAETRENPHGKFENCYESSLPDWARETFSDEDYLAEKCGLRIRLKETTYESREVYVMDCDGNCGKYCESHIPDEMLDDYYEYSDNRSFLF